MTIDFYEKASDCMAKSWEDWEKGEIVQSWGRTIPARLAYLCEAITNLVVLPFAILSVTFGALHALCTWNRKSEVYLKTYAFISKTTNHLFLSTFGSLISPAITHKYRDANIAPFILAARITVITAGLLYALLRR